ncbi:toll-like receptor 6 [Anabrus simplex]|uniref:toll-like receptor 6 n=1 Tax=Anabrus simplex TaxID=316456 RepID=UPI0035A36A1C
MAYLAVCCFFFFCCCCLASSAVQRRSILDDQYSSYEETLRRLSEGDNRTYYDNIVTSVKELSVELTFDKGISLQTRRAHFTAHDFPSSEEWIEKNVMRSVYVVKRVTRGEESYPVGCSTRGEPQDNEVQCEVDAEGMFTCKQVVPVNRHGMWAVKMVLSTEYHTLSALEKNGSLCVYEVRHELSVISENPQNYSLQPTGFLDSELHSIVNHFHEVHILAEVDSRLAVGVVNVDDNCQRNRSANQSCQAFLRPYEDAYQKSAILLQMALIPLIEQRRGFSNEAYSLAGMRERTFPHLLLQWQKMKVLDLSSTGFSFIDDDYFKGVPQVTVLTLSGNDFTAVPAGVKQLQGLLELDLSGNPLKNMTQLSNILQNLKTLKRLDLSEVPIGRLDPLYDGLTASKLRSLKMRRSLNSLMSKATRDTFKSMKNLEYLDLSDNPLSFIHKDLFSRMRVLKYLHLSNTNLSQSFKLHLNPVQSVHFIDLSHNQLTKVNTIDTCGTVQMLKIDHNFIEEWTDSDVFISSCKRPWLKDLNVSYNDIKEISVGMMLSLQYIRNVDIGHNPVKCDCDVNILRTWLNETRPCVSSPNFKCVPTEKCVSKKGYNISNIYWYLLIPFAIGLVMLAFIRVLTTYRRHQLAYLEYLDKKRKDNRNKAVALSKVVFQHDVYIVHSLEDTEWVNTVLLPRLQNYRVLVADPNGNDEERISNDIQNSRHLLFVVTDKFPQSEYCKHRLGLCNFAILNEEEHNLIFLMIHGVNRQAFPTNLKFLSSTYDSIDWPKEGKPDAKAFRKLISYLGTSTNQMWKINFKKLKN